MKSVCLLQVEVKGRVNLDKLTAFLEELRVSKSRTVSLGTLMSARDASAADKTHLVEVRHGCAASRQDTTRICSFLSLCGGLCWVINGHMQTLALHACTTVASLLCLCVLYVPCCASIVSCALQVLSLHCISGMVCFSSNKATAEDAVLTTHILARLLHSIAAVIVRSPCMLCPAQLAGSGSAGFKGLHLQSRPKSGASKIYKVSDNLICICKRT